jgi:hypothetical protein
MDKPKSVLEWNSLIGQTQGDIETVLGRVAEMERELDRHRLERPAQRLPGTLVDELTALKVELDELRARIPLYTRAREMQADIEAQAMRVEQVREFNQVARGRQALTAAWDSTLQEFAELTRDLLDHDQRHRQLARPLGLRLGGTTTDAMMGAIADALYVFFPHDLPFPRHRRGPLAVQEAILLQEIPIQEVAIHEAT